MYEYRNSHQAKLVNYTRLTANLIVAYVAHNSLPASDLPALITATHAAFASLKDADALAATAIEKLTPSQIQKSITHEALISFEDGNPYKTLKRHLRAVGLTPDAYRTKWGLPSDYPMTAPAYSERRSVLAKGFQLSRSGLASS